MEKIGGTKNHLDKIYQREHNDCLVFKPKRYNPFRRKVSSSKTLGLVSLILIVLLEYIK